MKENAEFSLLYLDLISKDRFGTRYAANRSIRKSLTPKPPKK
jgi:hypothetical protein